MTRTLANRRQAHSVKRKTAQRLVCFFVRTSLRKSRKLIPTSGYNRYPAWLTLLFLFGTLKPSLCQVPGGFTTTQVGSNWNQPTGISFSIHGKMFVWEKGGKVWVVENGVKSSQPFIDISEEVGNWRDHGLLGFALDPKFESNGFFYLLYTVDRHHLTKFGTASYRSTSNEYNSATIGRLTRYTANASDDFRTVDLSSRKILIGETISTGLPILYYSHGVGSLVFGTDGTLMLSCGDGSTYSDVDTGSHPQTYYAQALADGIIKTKENIGALRAQMIDALNGKILRVDPATGDGVPSNPYYDPTSPRAARSRVWALGFRNPFRFVKRPDTGSPNPDAGNPGVFYVGDVGWRTREELDVVTEPKMNFGWPIYEGFNLASSYSVSNVPNQDAYNPLYTVNGCAQPYFTFTQLLKEATLDPDPFFANSCNTAERIPASYTFLHTRPSIDWKHGSSPSRTGIFAGTQAGIVNVGATGSPVSGPQFGGSCSVAGVWYTGNNFPPEYKNTYFHADYENGWIRRFGYDGFNNPVSITNFIDQGANMVAMAEDPTDGTVCYAQLGGEPLLYEVRRISYNSNRPPVAVATVDKMYGASPLTVHFSSLNSRDPEGGVLHYEWRFGDGSASSSEVNPIHTFTATSSAPTSFTSTLKVTDNTGASSLASVVVSLNNTPPKVSITSPLNNTTYSIDGETMYDLKATVTDTEQDATGLTYQWQTTLHHNNHTHDEPIDNTPITSAEVAPIGCNGETYFYSFTLTVTDAAGLSGRDEVRVFPNCSLNGKHVPTVAWIRPEDIYYGTALGPTQLSAFSDVPGKFVYSPQAGTVLDPGKAYTLSVDFIPDDLSANNSVDGTTTLLNVNKAPSVIQFESLVNTYLGVAPIPLKATSNSALPIVFSVVNGPATIVDNQLHITDLGTVTIRASQVGNDYFEAGITEQTIEVGTLTAVAPVKSQQVTVFPNPSQGNFLVKIEGFTDSRVGDLILYNTHGQKILEQQVVLRRSETDAIVEADNLAKGVYIVQLTIGKEVVRKKVILY